MTKDETIRLRAEVQRLTTCLEKAGLQAFMRGKSPEEIAQHLRSVSASFESEIARLTDLRVRDAAYAAERERELRDAIEPLLEVLERHVVHVAGFAPKLYIGTPDAELAASLVPKVRAVLAGKTEEKP